MDSPSTVAPPSSVAVDPPGTSKIAGADGVRALACLLIFGHHATRTLHLDVDGFSRFFRDFGRLGVQIFFVLSGFLLTSPYWRASIDGGALPRLRPYVVRRLARVVPAYYVALFAMFVAFHPFTGLHLLRLASALTFTNSWHWRTYFPVRVNGAMWSIGVEMMFYVLLPIWALGLRRFRTLRSGRVYAVVSMLALASVDRLVIRAWPPLLAPADALAIDYFGDAVKWLPMRNPFALFSHFLIGGLAASFLVGPNAGADARLGSTADRWNRFDVIVALVIAALAVDLYWTTIPGLDGEVASFVQRLWSRRHMGFIGGGWPTFPLLVGVLLVSLARSARIGTLLDRDPLRTTARLSYGIYLWHMPVLYGLRRASREGGWFDGPLGAAGFVALALSLSYLIAALSYRFVEKPALDWSRRFTA